MTSFDSLPPVLKVEDLAKLLRCGRSQAYTLVREGHVRSVRVGRSIRIPKQAVIDFLGGGS